MKNIFIINILFAVFFISSFNAFGQCKQFAKNTCRVGLAPYQHDGNYHAAVLVEGEEAELYKTFHSNTN